ncbi:MAG: SDR family NAD(P)-dependent oxidoreductase [Pirellulaceae bacterium]|nr:SDR family NAD(P)-dependent oxidoreductase [Pirellulaceae bacterium]
MTRRDIAGLRTIVTGASSGIGRALVLELVRQGAKVVATARREDRLRELQSQVADGSRLRILPGDVTSAADRQAAIDLCLREFGGLDALVNNAGMGGLGPFEYADEARLRRVMEVNLFAPAEFMRQALPTLKAGNKPIIVNIASVLGHRAVPGKSEYCASKFALHGLSDSLRTEFGRIGIDLLLVCPSTTTSEFFDVAIQTEAQRRDVAKRPEGQFGIMSAEAVARKTVAAMRKGKGEIILSLGGTLLVWLDRLCPPAADWLVRRWT